MKQRLWLPLVLGSIALSALAAEPVKPVVSSSWPVELNDQLAPWPKDFSSAYHSPAQKLGKAYAALQKGNGGEARKILRPLLGNPVWHDYALYLSAKAEMASHEPKSAVEHLRRLQWESSGSPLTDKAEELLENAGVDAAMKESPISRAHLLTALERLPWRKWIENEEAVRKLWELNANAEAPDQESVRTEILAALPNDSSLRKEFIKTVNDPRDLTRVPRYIGYGTTSSVKSLFPDQTIFDNGMQLVLQEKWSEALDLFQQVTKDFPDSDHLDRATYWQGVCLEQLGKKEDAKKQWQFLTERWPLGYYGLQGWLRLGTDLKAQVLAKKQVLQSQPIEGAMLPRQRLAIWRTRALVEVGAIDLARLEMDGLFNYRPQGQMLGQDSAARMLTLARLYLAAGHQLGAFAHLLSLLYADQSMLGLEFVQMYFPRPFSEEVEKAAAAQGIHPLVIYSLIKQESAFQPEIVSKSDAMGLMQLIMPTAKEVDSKLTRDLLFQPSSNTAAGTAYLKGLLDKFQGNLALALAGYNAGPHRAVAWQKTLLESPLMKKEFRVDVFIDTIPFLETRRYVSSILRNYAWYRLLQEEPLPGTVQELSSLWKAKSPQPPSVIQSKRAISVPTAGL